MSHTMMTAFSNIYWKLWGACESCEGGDGGPMYIVLDNGFFQLFLTLFRSVTKEAKETWHTCTGTSPLLTAAWLRLAQWLARAPRPQAPAAACQTALPESRSQS